MNGAPHAVVIGGGIAGLAAAHALQQRADAAGARLRLTVLEREPRWGGKIRTEQVDGFVIEGGPDTFVATKPWGVALCRALGLESRLQPANAERRRVYVLRRGRLLPLPDGLAMMVPTRPGPMLRTPLLSPLGKLRLGLDLLLPARRADGDESLGAFLSRRLGREAYLHLIEPLMSGIYAGDGDRLSLRSTFPHLHEWERRHGSLARAAWAFAGARRAAAGGAPPSIFLTPIGGLGELVDALLERLQGCDLRAGAEAAGLERTPGGYRVLLHSGETLTAQAVVLAAPAFDAAALLAPHDPELAAALAAIEYVSTATVSLAYDLADLPRPLDGHGYVIPRAEGRPALACTWTSTKFPHRAPPGRALLRLFFGRAGQEQALALDDRALVSLARRELADTLGVQAEPRLARVARWPRAMPQYNLGHLERLAFITGRIERWPGLALAGAAYAGIGIPDCIHSAQQAAEAVWPALTAGAPLPAAALPQALS